MKEKTIAGKITATVLIAGMFAFMPVTTMGFNANNSGWHLSSTNMDEHENVEPEAAVTCDTDEDLENGTEGSGTWWHKESRNKDVFACKDHPVEQPVE